MFGIDKVIVYIGSRKGLSQREREFNRKLEEIRKNMDVEVVFFLERKFKQGYDDVSLVIFRIFGFKGLLFQEECMKVLFRKRKVEIKG